MSLGNIITHTQYDFISSFFMINWNKNKAYVFSSTVLCLNLPMDLSGCESLEARLDRQSSKLCIIVPNLTQKHGGIKILDVLSFKLLTQHMRKMSK